jgi:hypothetical protein
LQADSQTDDNETTIMADSDTGSEASTRALLQPQATLVTWLNHEDGHSGDYTPIHPERAGFFKPSFISGIFK